MMTCVVAVSCLLMGQQPNPPDQSGLEAIIPVIRAQALLLSEVYLEYEGRFLFPTETSKTSELVDDSGINERFTGSFRYRDEKAVVVDIFHRAEPKKNLLRRTLATLNGKTEEFTRADATGLSGGQIAATTPSSFKITGSYGQIFLIRELLMLLTSERDQFTLEAPEQVDGRTCEVLASRSGSGELLHTTRFWVDLERNAQVIKSEITNQAGMYSRVVAELGSFQHPKNGTVWLPVSGRRETFFGTTKETTGTISTSPTNLEEYAVVVTTVRLGAPSLDSAFTVNFRRGTYITDNLRQAEYEFGQKTTTRPATRAELEARLEEQLREAKDQKRVLDGASTVATVPNHTTGQLVGVGAATLGLAAVGFYFFKNRGR